MFLACGCGMWHVSYVVVMTTEEERERESVCVSMCVYV